jgi:hypothetical protein
MRKVVNKEKIEERKAIRLAEAEVKRINKEIHKYKAQLDDITKLIRYRKGLPTDLDWNAGLEQASTEELEEIRKVLNEHITELATKELKAGINKFFEFEREEDDRVTVTRDFEQEEAEELRLQDEHQIIY